MPQGGEVSSLALKKSIPTEPNVQVFENLKKDQLGVETILLNEVSRDFETNRWRKIEAAFYNVQLNGRKWDGIIISFANDKNDDGRYGDHLRVEQGKSNPDAFVRSAFNRGFVNDRGCER